MGDTLFTTAPESFFLRLCHSANTTLLHSHPSCALLSAGPLEGGLAAWLANSGVYSVYFNKLESGASCVDKLDALSPTPLPPPRPRCPPVLRGTHPFEEAASLSML